MYTFTQRYFFIFFILLCVHYNKMCTAQSILNTTVNTASIKIGEQFTVTINGTLSNAILKNALLTFPDSLLHFDIIDSGKIKLHYSNNQITGFTQNIVLTSFDSGTWAIPSFNISFIETTSNTTKQLFSNTLPIGVHYLNTDSSFTLKDVKPIIEIDSLKKDRPWYIIGSLSIIIFVIIWWCIIKYKKTNTKKPTTALSIYQTTMQQLNALAVLDVNNTAELMQYHLALKQIFKTYLFATLAHTQPDKSTTGILVTLKQHAITDELFTAVAHSLRMADAVQFAKYLPAASVSKQSLHTIQAVINYLHQQHI